MRLGAEFSACDVTMHKAYKVALTHQTDVEQTTQPIIHFISLGPYHQVSRL